MKFFVQKNGVGSFGEKDVDVDRWKYQVFLALSVYKDYEETCSWRNV